MQIQRLKRRLSRANGKSDELISYGDEAYDEGNYQEAMEFYLTTNQKDMVTICRIMQDKKVEKREYIYSLLESGILEAHPEALKHLNNQPIIKELLANTYNRLFGGKK